MSANIEQIKAMLERTGKTNLLQKQEVDLDKERLQLEAAVNKEKIDKNLEEAAEEYSKKVSDGHNYRDLTCGFIAGAEWYKEQFEKNRLFHCDAASKEDCDRETDFAMEIIEKEHRQPTFLDAINYGMRLQKEQKPAEWSEEDEDNLKAIIRIIEDNDSDWKELTDWLNSLHDNYKKCNSRWKPSEEQMSMLLAVINDPNNAGAESCQLALKSLYEQLKKLK